jgi:hypothetical protein
MTNPISTAPAACEQKGKLQSDALTSPDPSGEMPVAVERHYAPSMVAQLWQLDVETIRRLFQNEPGVVVLQAPGKKGKRGYKTILLFWVPWGAAAYDSPLRFSRRRYREGSDRLNIAQFPEFRAGYSVRI